MRWLSDFDVVGAGGLRTGFLFHVLAFPFRIGAQPSPLLLTE